MSIELELEDDGQVRVRVDTGGERAVSDTANPMELIKDICETAGIAVEHVTSVDDDKLLILLPKDEQSA